MQRYILDGNDFYKEDLHHIKNVMRFKSGQEVILCNNKQCFIAKLNVNDEITYEKVQDLNNPKYANVTLVQGNLKGTKLEITVKYATIFGATNIIITDFDRSVAKIKNEDNKLIRLNKIAKEAAELSHRSFIPKISFEKSLNQINLSEFNQLLLADEDEETKNLKDVTISDSDAICIVIGLEGGISSKEREMLKQKGFKTVSFGPFIYPAEIAALSGLVTINNKIVWVL